MRKGKVATMCDGDTSSRVVTDMKNLTKLTRESLWLQCDNERLEATGTKEMLARRLVDFYTEIHNSTMTDNCRSNETTGKLTKPNRKPIQNSKRIDNLNQQIQNSKRIDNLNQQIQNSKRIDNLNQPIQNSKRIDNLNQQIQNSKRIDNLNQ